ncbi:Rieske iron-sulfur protein of cytochrome b6f [Ostreococcus lucimarinus CCE9901]|uniref:plastoquinol--plastocyanin reductase n=2 Tax=Ostreococcus sp. 'lucimarinus' TaxID=242159 RepID=A4RS90_OSTLU|nr:Rieske iron-sulfur protein of cytochrome b6f [Ostreococcus lucimarinus CCE9901]ABO94328.1 Rieske iron-sulfur protein of cytochrome b6f [Ostreococcus lucimarinus CCE9901]|mmetsp:Transcript_2919/g.11253  ORF Transcript_2919/g.11253 Transcript_2919/m.11253 type:complete len:217 (+) Transcript_2919:47-697(+)|eukprot:XP_001416036.1 Rieske iron-sulfur protein of cytochrome b6f [Ostreococcus lucimarinus CCE9901]
MAFSLSTTQKLGCTRVRAQRAPVKRNAARSARTVVPRAASASADVPDMTKRSVMNLLLVGAIGLPATSLIGGYAYFFVPPSAGGGGAGQPAKDANGNDIKKGEWLKTHLPGDYSLTQGLKGDATYLIVKQDGSLTDFGLNAVCTHLGCVVPWNKAENKFKCPCHGSQYNADGKVIRGPAPLSLALAHVVVTDSDVVTFTPWTEADFRTGQNPPWWK